MDAPKHVNHVTQNRRGLARFSGHASVKFEVPIEDLRRASEHWILALSDNAPESFRHYAQMGGPGRELLPFSIYHFQENLVY